jgi:hypothetical protein
MKLKLLIFVLALTASGFACGGDDAAYKRFFANRPKALEKYDLLAIRSLGDEGRVQEAYDSSGVLERILKDQEAAVPFLIQSLTDARRTPEPVICLWNYTSVGDIAFVILTDLFSDASLQKSTIPGVSWDEMLGKYDGPGIYQLHEYLRRHGRKSLQKKWSAVWAAYRDKVVWDSKQRCFVLKSGLKNTAGNPARSG